MKEKNSTMARAIRGNGKDRGKDCVVEAELAFKPQIL